MATRCVAMSCDVDIFDTAHKKAVQTAIRETVTREVNKTKHLKFDDKCKDGWELKVKITVKVDDPKNPDKMEAKLSINAVPYVDGLKIVKANGSAKAASISKNMEKESVLATNDALMDALPKLLPPMNQ